MQKPRDNCNRSESDHGDTPRGAFRDLNVSGMLSNGNLALSISDCGFYEFKRQLEYKAEKFGCNLIIADIWYPSSKLCSTCGHKHESLTLSDRVYQCSNCGLKIDRDFNAAINLKKLAYPNPTK